MLKNKYFSSLIIHKIDKMFETFEKQSAKSWHEKIITDLKGADFEETLIWQSDEGISVNPAYSKEDRTSNGLNFESAEWEIVENIHYQNETDTNGLILSLLNKGVSGLRIDFGGASNVDFSLLFQNVYVQNIGLTFVLKSHNFHLVNDFYKGLSSQEKETVVLRLDYDVLSSFYQSGRMDLGAYFEGIKRVEKANFSYCIDLTHLQNSGARMFEQIAIGASLIQEYVEEFGKEVFSSLHIKLANAGNFFFEIAKQRAFRNMIHFLANEYDTTAYTFFSIENSLRNKTLYDPNVNMLRIGSEILSAALGGAQAIVSMPYDIVYKNPNEFSAHISRNQQIMLKEESNIHQVADAGNGAYYIETITAALEKKAYQFFQELEKESLKEYCNSGKLKSKLADHHHKDMERYERQEKPLLGTNLYPNPSDALKEEIEKELAPFANYHIPAMRIAWQDEQKRLDSEK